MTGTHVYLNPGVFERLEKDRRLAAVRAGIKTLPFVQDVFTRDQIEHATRDASMLGRVASSYDPRRGGDVVVVLHPYWMAYSASATTHGTAYDYDTRVPLVFMGFGIRPGEYFASATPLDIAPTLASLAGTTLPRAEGRVLYEALAAGKLRTTAGDISLSDSS